MVKSLRFLVILIALAAFGMITSVQSQAAQAPKDVVFKLAPVTPDNTTCLTGAVYVSKQLLPSTGLAVTSAGVEEDNATNPDAFDNGNGAGLNKIDGTTNKMVFTFDLTNGTFSNDLVLLLDNGTAKTEITPDYQTANKVQFTVEDANVDATNYTSLMLVDKSDNYTTTHLGIKVDGGLDNGGKVNLSLTTTWNGSHMYNGCFDKVIYVVENQWSAQLCCCKDSSPDTDYLVADANGVTVMDSETGITGFSLYNKCSTYENNPGTTGCCGSITPTCGLFCNYTSTSSTTSGVSCSMPGECTTTECPSDNGLGLKIVENSDFTNYPSYKVNSLANTNVTFTLTGNLKNIASIDLVSSTDGNPGAFVQPANLGTFSIDYTNNTATVTIPGTTLFVVTNGGVQTGNPAEPIHFKVKITPKSGVGLMPNKFYLSAVMEAGSDLANPQALNWGEIIDWTYNYDASYVFMAPYVRSDSSTTSVIRFENASKTAVGVSLYVNDPNGNSWIFVKHITIDPGKTAIEKGADFINDAAAVGITLDGAKGFAVYGIANANYRTFTVYGSQQYAGAGFRALPIDIFGMGATGQ